MILLKSGKAYLKSTSLVSYIPQPSNTKAIYSSSQNLELDFSPQKLKSHEEKIKEYQNRVNLYREYYYERYNLYLIPLLSYEQVNNYLYVAKPFKSSEHKTAFIPITKYKRNFSLYLKSIKDDAYFKDMHAAIIIKTLYINTYKNEDRSGFWINGEYVVEFVGSVKLYLNDEKIGIF